MTFESGQRFTVGSVSKYRISQLAQRSGVPATTLRFYESVGLLPAERTESGYRVYGEQAVDRLAFIGTAKQLGLPLDALPDRSGPCDPQCSFLSPAVPQAVAEDEAATSLTQRPSWRHAPVACSLTGGQQQERAEQWRRVLAGAEQEPIPEGVRLSLPADQAGAVAELAAAEQDCCPFFDFRLHLQHGCAHLEVRAPVGSCRTGERTVFPTS